MKFKNHIELDKGQSVFEVLIAMGIATLIVGSAVTAILVSMRSGTNTANTQKAYAIASATINNVRSFSESNWADLYAPPPLNDPEQGKGMGDLYHLGVVSTTTESTILGLATSTETISFTSTSTGENIDYTSWFTIADVDRDPDSNWIGPDLRDPTTLKITASVSWVAGGDTEQIDLVGYISKVKSNSITFSKWNGSSGVTTPVISPTNNYYSITNATITGSGTITY